MTSIRTTVCCCTLLFYLSSRGQTNPQTVPAANWELTFNPCGLLEYPGALGLGIGYRVNRNVQLWSETSWLYKGIVLKKDSITGIRQIFQVRYFLNNKPNFFIGLEARYKSINHWERDDFYNPSTHDTLMGYNNQAHRYFFGIAGVLGWHFNLGASRRFQVEGTVGLGWKSACVGWTGIPKGYQEHSFHTRVGESPFNDIPGDYSGPYLPCTIRVVYLLGKVFK